MTQPPIQAAIDCLGSQASLARSLGCTPALVSQWATGRRPVAAHWCQRIERATDGKVKASALRPDVFVLH